MLIALLGSDCLLAPAIAQAAALRDHKTHSIPETDDPTRAILDIFPDAILTISAFRLQPSAPPLALVANHLNARLIQLENAQDFSRQQRQPAATKNSTDAPAPPDFHSPPFTPCPSATLIRHGLLLGNSTGNTSFHEQLFAAWTRAETPELSDKIPVRPTSAETLASLAIEILERDNTLGTHTWTGAETTTPLALAKKIRDRFKLTETNAPLKPAPDIPDPDFNLQPSTFSLFKTRPDTLDEQLSQLILPPFAREWYFQQQ